MGSPPYAALPYYYNTNTRKNQAVRGISKKNFPLAKQNGLCYNEAVIHFTKEVLLWIV
jgi:hypothetical protein